MRDSLLSLELSHATLTEIFQWTWENNITEVTRASRHKPCVHDFMHTMIILLVWNDIYPSHPKVNSLQSLIELRFFFPLVFYCFLSWFCFVKHQITSEILYRCHHRRATYRWHFANLLWVITFVLTCSLYNHCRREKYCWV